MESRFAFVVLITALASACSAEGTRKDTRDSDVGSAALPTPLAASPSGAPATPAPTQAGSEASFGELVDALSEPDAAFFSDNYISNETSYLQIAPQLSANGGTGDVYIGVGPEQNFTYIALTRPRLAFILDIRRQNMILHLFYRAAFEEATTRSHFVALLLGRPYDRVGAPGPDATIDEVLAHAERLAPDAASFDAAHAQLRGRVAEYGVALSPADFRTLDATHRAFFKAQLGLRFELKEASGRRYPTLRDLLVAEDPSGQRSGFLAREDAFHYVQALEKQGHIVPVVGDFAGSRALRGVAAEVMKRGLTVSTFYVSNVEQYLFAPGVWAAWASNVAALPTDDHSVFIRAYLDQGQRHPLELKGHRTATFLQRIHDFNERQKRKPYRSFWEVATDKPSIDAPQGR